MVRQANGTAGRFGRGGSRSGYRGRGQGRGGYGDTYFGGRGGIQKPPPLMARPMPPPNALRPDLFRGQIRPMPPPLMPNIPGMNDFGRMGPPRMAYPSGRGTHNLRMGPRGRGLPRPLLRGMPRPRAPNGLLPPPGPIFRPPPLMPPQMMVPPNMRGRGMPGRIPRGAPPGRGINFGRGGPNNRRGGRPQRGRGAKNSSSPSRELNKPWVTEAMKNEILKKHKLHQKAKKARTKEDFHELWEAFKEHRNKVTTMLREAKLEYIGAHPDEDVDKILAEATTQLSNKDEQSAESDGNGSSPNVTEGVEPMEEGGGANEAEPPQDPEVEMKPDLQPSPGLDIKTEPKPDSEEPESRLEFESKSMA